MLINGLTSITGGNNFCEGCNDLYHKKFSSAGKNFAEAALRSAACVTVAVLARVMIDEFCFNRPEKFVDSDNVRSVTRFCDSYYPAGIDHRSCVYDIMSKVSETTFKKIISNPDSAHKKVEKYCYEMGLFGPDYYFKKCWELVSKDMHVLDRIVS
jgi:hypothetical protein